MAALERVLPDAAQRSQAAEIISKIAQQQFPDFKMDFQANKVNVGSITQRTDGPCSPAVAGVGGNVTINSNCTTSNSTIETQNNVRGNQFNNPNNVNQFINKGTLNNQGGINLGTQPAR